MYMHKYGNVSLAIAVAVFLFFSSSSAAAVGLKLPPAPSSRNIEKNISFHSFFLSFHFFISFSTIHIPHTCVCEM